MSGKQTYELWAERTLSHGHPISPTDLVDRPSLHLDKVIGVVNIMLCEKICETEGESVSKITLPVEEIKLRARGLGPFRVRDLIRAYEGVGWSFCSDLLDWGGGYIIFVLPK